MPTWDWNTSKWDKTHVFCSADCTASPCELNCDKHCNPLAVNQHTGKPYKMLQDNIISCTLLRRNCFTCVWWGDCPVKDDVHDDNLGYCETSLEQERTNIVEYLKKFSQLVVVDEVSYFLTKRCAIMFLLEEIARNVGRIFKILFRGRK